MTSVINTITGTSGDDTLNDTDASDIILGLGGDDSIVSAHGIDAVFGGAGNDFILGYSGGLFGDAGDDTIIGLADGPMLIDGGAGKDTIFAFLAPNADVTILGGAGADRFDVYDFSGGSGSARITGGAGRDAFVTEGWYSEAHITVTDFDAGARGDIVDFSSDLINTFSNWGYTGGDLFALGYVRYVQSGHDVLVQTDVDGAAGGVFGFHTAMVLKNVDAADLVRANFVAYTGNVIGDANDNDLTANAGDNVVMGLGGNDTIDATAAGTHTLAGGDGDDLYIIANSDDRIIESGAGWDVVWSTASYTLTDNLEELDLLGTANLNGTGNTGDNYIYGNSGDNVLKGMDGNDTLDATAGGHDTLIGGNGDDVYWISDASDVITETNASDDGGWDAVWSAVSYTLPTNVEELDLLGTANINATGNAGANYLDGNAGDNVLNGMAGDVTLVGNDGNDTLQGGGGADSMAGGDGSDYYYVDNAGDVVVEDAGGTGWDQVESSITYTLTANVEELDLLGTANINATGNELDNYIYGNSGNNLLSGMAGNDTIDATAGGKDTLQGGDGDDVYWINTVGDVIIETNAGASGGWDDVWSSVSYTLPTNVEELDLLGSGNINATGNAGINYLYGNSGNNVLNGLAGNDTLVGNAGNDTLQGGGGADLMQGGAGDDYYYVDNGGDVVSEESTPGIDDGGYDHVASSITYTLGAHVEELDLIGTANINGTGNALDNYIYGNAGNNVLGGAAGNDTIDATAGGLDTLVGGAGDDVYWIANGQDVITENANSGWDAVWSSATYTLAANVEELDLLGTANINGTGNSGDNYLSGNSGKNVLTGGDGNDTLAGNAGADTLVGGNGADQFVFSAAATNGLDVIQDFVHGVDQLVFSKADYGFGAGHVLTASEFTAGTSAVGASAQFIWDAATHTLYWDSDGTGSHAAIAIATFTNGATVDASDFHFV